MAERVPPRGGDSLDGGWLSRLPGPALLGLAAAGYFIPAQTVIFVNDSALIGIGFWPSAGVTLALLLLVPTRRWAWALAGVALAEGGGDLLHGYPTAGIPWYVAGNVLDPLIGASVIRRFGSPRGELLPLRNLLVFLGGGVVLATVVGTTVGNLGTTLNTDIGWWESWPPYVTGDALGVLVVAPVLLTWREPSFRRRRWEFVAALGALVLVEVAVAMPWPDGFALVLPYLAVPFLTWGALRFGIRGTALLVLVLAVSSNVVTVAGYGPFRPLDVSAGEARAMGQLYLLVVSSSTLVLAALVNELSHRDSVERLLRDVVDTTPHLAWVSDRTGMVEYFNRQDARYARGSEGDLWHARVHADDGGATRSAWSRALASGAPFELEHRLAMADGSYRWHVTRAERVDGIDGARWFGTSTDVHEWRLADELKDQFVATAAHELRNPVAAVHGTAQLLRRYAERNEAPEHVRRALEALIGSTTDLARLTEELTDVSQLHRGALEIRREPHDVTALLEAVCGSSGWPPGRVRLDVRGELGTVTLDGLRIRQVLSNVIDNALKYSPAGTPVLVRAEPDGGGVRIAVVDRGIGIPSEALARIFSPFGRAENTGAIHGLGLGLYVAREIIEGHGGRLSVASDGVDAGTTMTLWLPGLPGARRPRSYASVEDEQEEDPEAASVAAG